MSGTLQCLLNPLEMQDSLPSSMSLRKDFSATPISTYWSELVQYYANDVVFSNVNDGAYIMWGGTDATSSYRGGDDPSLNTDYWLPLTSYGIQTAGAPLTAIAPTPLTPSAGGVYTFTSGAASPAFYDSTYVQVVLQGQITGSGAGAAMAATDFVQFLATPTGTTAVTSSVWTVPTTGAVGPQYFSVSMICQCGTSTTAATDKVVTLSATSGSGAATPVLNNLKVTWIPLNFA